jgi:hypothetical protein
MPRASRGYLIVAVMGASLVAIVVMGWAFHIGLLFVLVAGLSVLFAMGYAWRRSRTAQPNPKIFWAVLEASLVFFAGALYGIVESLREGWQWTDLLYLVVPVALGSYLLWFAMRIRRKTAT